MKEMQKRHRLEKKKLDQLKTELHQKLAQERRIQLDKATSRRIETKHTEGYGRVNES